MKKKTKKTECSGSDINMTAQRNKINLTSQEKRGKKGRTLKLTKRFLLFTHILYNKLEVFCTQNPRWAKILCLKSTNYCKNSMKGPYNNKHNIITEIVSIILNQNTHNHGTIKYED